MRYKLLDKTVLDEKLKREIAIREPKKEPFLLWGIVNTRWRNKEKDGTKLANPKPEKYPHLVIQTFKAGIRIAEVEEYAAKGFILLHAYFPRQEDLPTLRKEGIVSESGWRMELRNDASYFNEVKEHCQQLMLTGHNPLQSVVDEQAKELEELRALHGKASKLKDTDESNTVSKK